MRLTILSCAVFNFPLHYRDETKIIFGAIIAVLVIGGLVYISRLPGKLDTFATCLKDTGAVFYGAFWCPHCQEQKALFGRSRSKLPYIECSTPDGNSQTQVCKDKKVVGYPTWEFADGTRDDRLAFTRPLS